MNALEALIGVIIVQLATTLKGVTPAFATVDTKAMDFLALVSSYIYFPTETDVLYLIFPTQPDINECLSNNGSCHHFCRDLDGNYACSCNTGYQLNSDGQTCEG